MTHTAADETVITSVAKAKRNVEYSENDKICAIITISIPTRDN
jgi:hypothetical protein